MNCMTNLSNVSRSLHVQVQLALPCKDVQLCVQYTTEERSFMHFFPAEHNPENNKKHSEFLVNIELFHYRK
jgi:hypothetical protein